MKLISFSWTTPAVKAHSKCVTRREWKPAWAERFRKDEIVQAWDRLPRVKGAKQFGLIQLVEKPFLQSTAQLVDMDWHDEGFAYLTQNKLTINGLTPLQLWDAWVSKPRDLWVVKFKILEIYDGR